jgi:phosphoribosylglycinamide formyltransferase-1
VDLGVLISGRGSNLQVILDAVADERLDAKVRLVLTNRAKAAGLERATKAGVPTAVLSHRDFADRESFDAALVERLKQAGVDWVVLAGFMRIVTPVFLDAFPNRVINIHPSLLPCFPGVDAQAQALAYGVRVSGCTVHLVNEGVDAGPILAQAVVPVRHDDTRDELAMRILEQEHRLLVQTLQAIAEGGLEVEEAADGGRPSVRLRPNVRT